MACNLLVIAAAGCSSPPRPAVNPYDQARLLSDWARGAYASTILREPGEYSSVDYAVTYGVDSPPYPLVGSVFDCGSLARTPDDPQGSYCIVVGRHGPSLTNVATACEMVTTKQGRRWWKAYILLWNWQRRTWGMGGTIAGEVAGPATRLGK